MIKKIFQNVFFVFLFSVLGCLMNESNKEKEIKPLFKITNEWAPLPYKLNVVYLFQMTLIVLRLSSVFELGFSDRTKWTVEGSQAVDPLRNFIDGNVETNWHTPWCPFTIPHPHYFIVDTKVLASFNNLNIYNRANLNGSLKDFVLSVSNDGVTWSVVSTYTVPQIAGRNYIPLNKNVKARYIKLETINSNGNLNYTYMAEFDVFQY